MTNEEYKANLSNIMEQKGRESAQAISEVGKDIKLQLSYHKSFLEEQAQKNRQDIIDIKERLEYLSTEVNID
jgi:flagellar motility protein MotE (MotC chaperone)